jgi:DNA-directed RNA polymerase subunit K/omega
VIDKSRLPNSFEFVIVAGARARQLIKGATPRIETDGPPVRVAQAEVDAGKVRKIETTDPGAGPERDLEP